MTISFTFLNGLVYITLSTLEAVTDKYFAEAFDCLLFTAIL